MRLLFIILFLLQLNQLQAQLSDTHFEKTEQFQELLSNYKDNWRPDDPSFFLYRTFGSDSVLEYWYVKDLGENSFDIKITCAHVDIYYMEMYNIYNGELLYSMEEETYYDFGSSERDQGVPWQGFYFWENDKIINYHTNGHGKSETDDWEPYPENWHRYLKRWKQLNRK